MEVISVSYHSSSFWPEWKSTLAGNVTTGKPVCEDIQLAGRSFA
jgi:hypothetical protein